VVDEPRRRGFAYGTLPGHPERGEEAFLITHHDDGTVTFAITAFCAPGSPLARAAGRWGGPSSATSPAVTCARWPADPEESQPSRC